MNEATAGLAGAQAAFAAVQAEGDRAEPGAEGETRGALVEAEAAVREAEVQLALSQAASGAADGTGEAQPHGVDEGIRFDATLQSIAGVRLLQEGGPVDVVDGAIDPRRRLIVDGAYQVADGQPVRSGR